MGWGLCCVCVCVNNFANYLTFSPRNSFVAFQHAKIYLQVFKEFRAGDFLPFLESDLAFTCWINPAAGACFKAGGVDKTATHFSAVGSRYLAELMGQHKL